VHDRQITWHCRLGGYTLIFDQEGTPLAEHPHFESIEDTLTRGADIIPHLQEIQRFSQPRRVGETESGDAIRSESRCSSAW